MDSTEDLEHWLSQPDVCRCCLSDTGTRDVTAAYIDDSGSKEVYSDMLKECYGITLSYLVEWGPSRMVCGLCVEHLRDADNFRQRVLQAEVQFVEYYKNRKDIVLHEAKIKTELEIEMQDVSANSYDENGDGSTEFLDEEFLEEKEIIKSELMSQDETNALDTIENSFDEIISTNSIKEPVKRKRGRPRKYDVNTIKNKTSQNTKVNKAKKLKKSKLESIDESDSDTVTQLKDNIPYSDDNNVEIEIEAVNTGPKRRVRRRNTEKKRLKIPEDALREAVREVLKGQCIRKVALSFAIPKSTLFGYVKQNKNRTPDEVVVHAPNYAVHKIFTIEEEHTLCNYLEEAAALHIGLTVRNIRKLAYEFALIKCKKVPPNWHSEKLVGREWFYSFRKRFPVLENIQRNELISLARATASTRNYIESFYVNLQEFVQTYNFAPENIYNIDETGNASVRKPGKVLTPKSLKQSGQIIGNTGPNITIISCVNAIGNTIPPMLIFPRDFFKEWMLTGAPPGSIGASSISGSSNHVLFRRYLDHFIACVKPSVQNPVLLIIDNDDSHISIEVIDKAKENGIVLVTLHSHISKMVQPLDRSVFGVFRTFYNKYANDWLSNHPGKHIPVFDIAEIVGQAYPKAFTLENIIKSFQVTGIYPLKADIFSSNEIGSAENAVNKTKKEIPIEMAEEMDDFTWNNNEITEFTEIPLTAEVRNVVVEVINLPKANSAMSDADEFGNISGEKKNPNGTTGKLTILSDDATIVCVSCSNLCIKDQALKCNICENSFHRACVSEKHLENVMDSDEENLFVCENCSTSDVIDSDGSI